jgi:hypothetical protein
VGCNERPLASCDFGPRRYRGLSLPEAVSDLAAEFVGRTLGSVQPGFR